MTAVLYALLADAALPPDYFFGSGDTDYLAMMLLYFFAVAQELFEQQRFDGDHADLQRRQTDIRHGALSVLPDPDPVKAVVDDRVRHTVDQREYRQVASAHTGDRRHAQLHCQGQQQIQQQRPQNAVHYSSCSAMRRRLLYTTVSTTPKATMAGAITKKYKSIIAK